MKARRYRLICFFKVQVTKPRSAYMQLDFSSHGDFICITPENKSKKFGSQIRCLELPDGIMQQPLPRKFSCSNSMVFITSKIRGPDEP